MNQKVKMIELNAMLVLRPGFHAELNLDHLGREIIHEGDLQRMGSKGVRWVDTHALLFDHYFILAKLIQARDGRPDKKYDVSKEVSPTNQPLKREADWSSLSRCPFYFSIAATMTR